MEEQKKVTKITSDDLTHDQIFIEKCRLQLAGGKPVWFKRAQNKKVEIAGLNQLAQSLHNDDGWDLTLLTLRTASTKAEIAAMEQHNLLAKANFKAEARARALEKAEATAQAKEQRRLDAQRRSEHKAEGASLKRKVPTCAMNCDLC